MRLNKVEISGVDTSKLKSLSEDEKRKLLYIVKNGDEKERTEARNAMIMGNLRLVLSVVSRFTPKRETVDDLFQVGCIGLMKAIDNFNLSLDVRFSTYAVPMIIGEVRRYQRDNNSVRVSRGVRDLAYKALMVKEDIMSREQREPPISEIAKRLDTTERAVGEAMEAIVEPISIFDSVWGEGEDSVYVIDKLKDERESDEVWVENIALKEALSHLNEREWSVIYKRFFKGKTQMEIASEVSISQAQVSRIEKGAIEKMRKYMQ